MPQFTLSVPGDFEKLGERWRALEAEADASFFQSWTWVGCEVAARFPDPILIEATLGGETMALALCNRIAGWSGDTLWLGESGLPAWDSLFVEHNGPLVAATAAPDVIRGLLKTGLGRLGRRLVLSGVRGGIATAARMIPGTLELHPDRPSPCVDFNRLRATASDHAASLSANTRQQIRRSLRRYQTNGPIVMRRAADVPEALACLDGLVLLHQESWRRRNRQGAFAVPEFYRFHRALIARAIPRREAELLHFSAGGQTIGYLYNFLWRGWVLAYQSGFAYPHADPRRKPGLTCHHLAIEAHMAEGMNGYDFLAGEARYKTSFTNSQNSLSWLELGPVWRPASIEAWLRRMW